MLIAAPLRNQVDRFTQMDDSLVIVDHSEFNRINYQSYKILIGFIEGLFCSLKDSTEPSLEKVQRRWLRFL